VEAYELTTHGGATDFALIAAACDAFGPWCLIGGLAVNHYVEPVYTLDADIVVIASRLPALVAVLRVKRFQVEEHAHSVYAQPPASDLPIQFTTDLRYQEFSPVPAEPPFWEQPSESHPSTMWPKASSGPGAARRVA
jgi:hypothetical protein